MELKGKKIGIAFCGSFCTFDKVFHELEHLKETGAEIYPVFSDAAKGIESRFGKPADFIKKAEEIAGRKPILCIEEAEPIGPKGYLDLLAIIPCTGNTAAKLANGITDTAVLMAAKAHLRNGKPLVIFISTNDGLGMKMKNIGTMLIVAHRLSTIQHADNIILLSHGRIMEQGTHQQLLNCKGRYYDLYTLQYHREMIQGGV